MGPFRFDNHSDTKLKTCRPCWREMLAGALAGLYVSDQQLEQMLDHLERAS